MLTRRMRLLLTASALLTLPLAGVQAATIVEWNTANVVVGGVVPDGETGYSVIYNGNVADGGTLSTSGQIAYSPPEAVSPGIKVQPQIYNDTGSGATLTFDGCLMTSNEPNLCDGEFQSGKRIKQQMTGFEPVDLVFNVANSREENFYQVFGRLINATGAALSGFTVQLGYGVGSGFTAFEGPNAPVTFSSLFTAQPNSSGLSSTSQFPFGLFGAAVDSPNFLLDGFFTSARTGFNLEQTDTKISSAGYYGDYRTLFGDWIGDPDALPQGLFWDFDNNEATDALLLGWKIGDDLWQVRRNVGETCGTIAGVPACTPGEQLSMFDWFTGTYDQVVDTLKANFLSEFGSSEDWFANFLPGLIEDLANLNLNYALKINDFTGYGDQYANLGSSFTIRTFVAPIPLPAGAPLLIGALGALALLRRRARLAA